MMRLIDVQVDAQVAAQNSANFTNIGGVIQAFTRIDLTAARFIESSSTHIERSPCIHHISIEQSQPTMYASFDLYCGSADDFATRHHVMHAESNCMSTHCHCIAIDLPLHPRIRRTFVPCA